MSSERLRSCASSCSLPPGREGLASRGNGVALLLAVCLYFPASSPHTLFDGSRLGTKRRGPGGRERAGSRGKRLGRGKKKGLPARGAAPDAPAFARPHRRAARQGTRGRPAPGARVRSGGDPDAAHRARAVRFRRLTRTRRRSRRPTAGHESPSSPRTQARERSRCPRRRTRHRQESRPFENPAGRRSSTREISLRRSRSRQPRHEPLGRARPPSIPRAPWGRSRGA